MMPENGIGVTIPPVSDMGKEAGQGEHNLIQTIFDPLSQLIPIYPKIRLI